MMHVVQLNQHPTVALFYFVFAFWVEKSSKRQEHDQTSLDKSEQDFLVAFKKVFRGGAAPFYKLHYASNALLSRHLYKTTDMLLKVIPSQTKQEFQNTL